MDFRQPESYLEGAVLYFDKPLNWTSFDVVNKVRISLRTYLGIRKIKVGHAGTLDPLATGLMIICTGKGTKQISQFQDMDKEYIAQIRLGTTTPSFDLETEVDFTYPWNHLTLELVHSTLQSFTGEQEQAPPLFSAKYVDGKRAYELARKGRKVELRKQRIVIHHLELISFDPPDLTLRIICSKGTYIRSIARDLAVAMGTGGHLTGLRRTAIGSFKVTEAISPDNFIEIVKHL
jgi:tRNA pseudouridine55 synthase